MYALDSSEAKYQLLINKREITGLHYSSDLKALIEYSIDMADSYKNVDE